MPRKTTAPKPIVLALTSDKTGVTLRVGNSPTTAATLYPRHVTELAKLLGVTLSADGKSVAQWIEAVKTAEAERDAAKKQESVWKENYHLAAEERAELRLRKDNLEAEQRLVARLREDNEQLGKERDQARADAAAADVTLQETLDDLKKARLQRDAAEADRNVWEAAAKADRAQLVTLADELNRERQKLRDIEKLRAETINTQSATILGWRLATVAMAIVAVVLAAWRAGR